MARIDWGTLKSEYLAGGISYRALAEKHGVSLNTLEKRAKREGWSDGRRQVGGIVAAEMTAIVAQKQVEAAEEWHAEMLGLARVLRLQLEAKLSGVQQLIASSKEGPVVLELPCLNTTRDLKIAVDALDSLSGVARKWLGLDRDASKDGLKDLGSLFDEAMLTIEARESEFAASE